MPLSKVLDWKSLQRPCLQHEIITQQNHFYRYYKERKECVKTTAAQRGCSPDSKVLIGCVLTKRDQKSSLPCFEVCNAEAVCGVQANTAIPNYAAQQWPQLRWNPMQRNLRGHVVHFNQFLQICTDTFTTQYTALTIGPLDAVEKLLLFTPQMILIKQSLTIKMCRKIMMKIWGLPGRIQLQLTTMEITLYTSAHLISSILACHWKSENRKIARSIHAIGS